MPESDENRKEQIDIRLSISPLIEVLGYPEDSLQILQDAVRIAEESGDMRNEAIFHSNISNYYVVKGNLPEAMKYSAKGFEEAEKSEDIDLMVPTGYTLMRTVFTYGDLKKAIEVASKVIHMIEKTHRESDFFGRPYNAYSEFLIHCAHNLAFHGNLKKAEGIAEKGLLFAKEINHLPSIANAELFLSLTFAHKGDGRNVIKHAEEGMKYCTEGEVDFFLPYANLLFVVGHFYLEEYQTAREFLQRALQIQEDMESQIFASSTYTWLVLVETELGNFKSAQDYAEKGLAFTQKNSERLFEGHVWAGKMMQ